MPAGDLLPDQARYVDLVSSETGLDRTVVVAWVGSESGWLVNKAGHNYLNVGPGYQFASTEQAAARVAGLINDSDLYYGIRAAIPAGPAAQVKAIGASRWGTSAALLSAVWAQLVAGGTAVHTTLLDATAVTPSGAALAQNVGFWEDTLKTGKGILAFGTGDLGGVASALPSVSGLAGGAASALGIPTPGDIVGGIVKAGATLIFTAAAFGIIAMALNRLTGVSPVAAFQKVAQTAGPLAAVAAL